MPLAMNNHSLPLIKSATRPTPRAKLRSRPESITKEPSHSHRRTRQR